MPRARAEPRVAESGLSAHLQAEYDELMAGMAWLFEKARKPGPREASALAKRVVALYDRFIKES